MCQREKEEHIYLSQLHVLLLLLLLDVRVCVCVNERSQEKEEEERSRFLRLYEVAAGIKIGRKCLCRAPQIFQLASSPKLTYIHSYNSGMCT